MRLGAFHSLDDQFYIDTYNAEFWSQIDHDTYPNLVPTKVIDQDSTPPIKRSKLLITTDSIQYWEDWKNISFLSKIILFLMGFRLGLVIGRPWLKKVSIPKGSLKRNFYQLLNLDFKSLVAAHGNILKGDARSRLTDIVSKTFK